MKATAIVIIVMAMTGSTIGTYRNGRAIGGEAFDINLPHYQGFRQHPPFDERLESFRPQHHSFAESSFNKPSYFRDYNAMSDSTSSYKNHPQYQYREESFYRDTPPPIGIQSMNFRERLPYKDHSSLKEQETRFADEISFTMPPYVKQESYHRSTNSYRDDESQSLSNSMNLFNSQQSSFKKPMDSYREEENEQRQGLRQPLSFGGHSNYLKYGNYDLGFASIPLSTSYENLASEIKTSTPSPMPPTATHTPLAERGSSTTNDMTASRSTESSAPHLITTPTTTSTITPPTMSLNDQTHTMSDSMMSSVSSTMQLHQQKTSNDIISSETPLTAITNSPIIQTHGSSIATFNPNTPYHTNRYSTPPATFYLSNGLKSTTVPNVVVPNYLLQNQLQRDLMIPSQPDHRETFNYIQHRNINNGPESNKFSLSTSNIPHHLETSMNYVPSGLTRLGFLSTDSLGLRNTLPTSLSNNIPGNGIQLSTGGLSANFGHGLSSNIPGTISTINMPTNIATSLSENLPTLNFAQSFPNLNQVHDFNQHRTSSYSPGLQLQLGGSGGIDYLVQPNNLAPRPIEFGLAEVGLGLSNLARSPMPTFDKVIM